MKLMKQKFEPCPEETAKRWTEIEVRFSNEWMNRDFEKYLKERVNASFIRQQSR